MDRDTLRSILERANIQNIRPTGEGFEAVCFKHGSSSGKPNWKINADNGLWLCWKPTCGITGNLITLLTQCLHMPMQQAIKYLDSVPRVAKGDELTLPDYDRRWLVETPHRPERLLAMYHHCPRYMLQRGFSKPFLKEFDIGFDEEAHRVTFPVRAMDGRLLGFTRRRVDGESDFKYLHDIEGGNVRSMYLVERVNTGRAIGITEGPVDALRSRQRARQTFRKDLAVEALHNMCAVLHDGITVYQAVMVAQMAPPAVVLGFDLWKTTDGVRSVDVAGVAATHKSIKNLRKVGISDIHVLQWNSFDDLGDLTLPGVDELQCLTATDWLLSQ
jgi:hypothetical protein